LSERFPRNTSASLAEDFAKQLFHPMMQDSVMTEENTAQVPEKSGNFVIDMPPGDLLARGIVTGVVVSAITQTGRNILGKMVKNPIVIFGLGCAAGFLAHKYRKEILQAGGDIGEKSKEFVLNQKEKLGDMLAEYRESAADAGEGK
jgi:hypothetical protein